MEAAYLLALDGGQTSTKALVATTEGRILGRATGPATGNLLSDSGRERLFQSVKETLGGALQEAFGTGPVPVFAAMGCSMSGMGRHTPDLSVLFEYIRSLVTVGQIRVEWDGLAALAGASVGSTGVVVISGGGSVAAGLRRDGTLLRAGGWGHDFGDAASGFDIARQAVIRACMAHDGMAPATTLGEATCRHFDVPSLRAVKWLRDAEQLDDAKLATLVQVVVKEAEAGDTVARSLLAEAGAELARLAIAVVRRMGEPEPVPIFPTGGVLREVALVREAFIRGVEGAGEAAVVREPAYGPLVGAFFFALQASGRQVTPNVTAAIDASW